MKDYILIGAGGFLGAIARYAAAYMIGLKWGKVFPVGTFVVNVTGCFMIGLLMTLFTEKYMAPPQWRLFLVVGFLGAYTTFSTFEYETNGLLRDGEWLLAGMNVALSVIAGFAALKIGDVIGKLL